ncbi:Mn(2+) transporter ATX2 KNAG_0L02000 [Huiozyma naganishii CBS 8797]|uniref:Zinc/iron permease n=1 Tax=Huiozyma naganishii (strain ATCC MYA-139 / BCRC 22969 / CBS 8797 / KCTC 17520 / NBRC 10181 / NCYC 3082 / Yp74L-3) TaxID=1071383 RepID=J7SAK2_HUIN7|nr:hypothetical protein KNAG_0L02000 [Kazachstania naganishii CBS 8797]CCK72819.1 hypothetical protein KNAG_0L02000 [Kazachstania naganishii CBS 8797]
MVGQVWANIALSLVLLLATFLCGLIPLCWMGARDGTSLDKLAQFGVGMLLGTSFMLVVPEGIRECQEHGGNVGLDLLVGFLVVYLLDRIVQLVLSQKGRLSNAARMPVQPPESLRDVLRNPKQVWVNILSNNVVFALFVHGLSDGIALGTTVNNPSLLVVVLVAIIIHKVPAVLSLTSVMVCKQNLPKWEVIPNLMAFSLSTPIGYLILSTLNLNESQTMTWMSGNLLLMSGGSLLYAAFTAFVSGTGSHDHASFDDVGVDEFEAMAYFDTRDCNAVEDSSEPELPGHDMAAAKSSLDKSVYVLLGVILPTIISFVIKE